MDTPFFLMHLSFIASSNCRLEFYTFTLCTLEVPH
jgi:hypothetical protein